VLLFELCGGLPPFYCEEQLAMYQRIMHVKFTFPQHFSKVGPRAAGGLGSSWAAAVAGLGSGWARGQQCCGLGGGGGACSSGLPGDS
jgi:hypothetical protein